MTVRTETPDDAAAVRAVLLAAFPLPVEADLVDALRADGDVIGGLCLVAERDGAVAGSLVCSRAMVGDAVVAALAPTAVLPGSQRCGLGTALVRECVAQAARDGLPAIVVLGHPEYYPRFGAEPARALGIESAFPAPDEAWMAIRLPAWTSSVRGTVEYAPAFSRL